MLLVGLNNMGDGLPTNLGDIYTHVRPCGCTRFILDFAKEIYISKISLR